MQEAIVEVREVREVAQALTRAAALEQLAEECSELGHACLKYARAIRQENPTPVSITTCKEHLNEETADVMNAILMLRSKRMLSGIVDIQRSKIQRARERLDV